MIEPINLDKTILDMIDFTKKVDEKYYYTKDKCIFYDELEKSIVKKIHCINGEDVMLEKINQIYVLL